MTFSVNKSIIAGAISDGGVKLSYTSGGKPECRFTLVLEKVVGGHIFKGFVPVCILGDKAEPLAERLEANDMVMITGEIGWRSGKTLEGGKLCVIAFDVERLMPAAAVASVN
jgi:hypothetical protein